jgi:probable rRNA maturation factor
MRTSPKSAAPQSSRVVSVSTRGGPFEGVSAAAVRRRAEKMLEHLGLEGVELSVGLVNDAAIHELNRSFRHKDKPTDVLAFPMLDVLPKTPGRRGTRGAAPALREVTGLLGDVIISIETAERQARENDRPLSEELTMLLAHGLLHLLGYDHLTDAEERAMTEATRELEKAAASRAAKTAGPRQASSPATPEPRRARRKAPAGTQARAAGTQAKTQARTKKRKLAAR